MIVAHLHDFYDYSWVILAAVLGFGAGRVSFRRRRKELRGELDGNS